ncbi:MAG TPA: ATPase [Chitinophagaceae bacterium]|nr:ATPase [Chitinophagaceae bacterium]
MLAVTVHNISKRFGKKEKVVTALDNISFNVAQGSLFGIIGPDGAGKTTLFRILTTLLLADEGIATVNGWDVVKDFKKIRSTVGYMPGKFSLYQDLTVEENLQFFATIFNTTIQANYHLIKDIYEQIAPFKNRRAGKLSGGMKQKLALCCALIHKPAVLLLDEPTTGVDAVSREEFWDMLQHLQQQGITILVSTPYMDEASLCNTVALMQHGQIMKVDTPQNIIASFDHTILAVKDDNMLSLLNTLQQHPQVKDAYAFGEYHHAVLHRGISNISLPQSVIQHPTTATIEDCFMALMKSHE